MSHRDKSLWPHIGNKVDIETRSPDVIVIDHIMPTSAQMREVTKRAIDAGERLGASHDMMTPAELGTAMHQEIERKLWGTADEIEEPLITGHYHIGDSHIGMGREELNRQLMAYATLMPPEGVAYVVIAGGDLIHGNVPRPDAIIVLGGVEHHIDYKTTEERVLQHMDSLDPRRYQQLAVDTPDPDKIVKPVRGTRAKDWEQRNRKRKTMNRKNIADAALARIESDAGYAERHGVIRFGCDHSHLLISANRKGEIVKDLLYDGRGHTSNGVAAHLLQHCSPATMKELVRAYRFAKANGLPEIDTITGLPVTNDKS